MATDDTIRKYRPSEIIILDDNPEFLQNLYVDIKIPDIEDFGFLKKYACMFNS